MRGVSNIISAIFVVSVILISAYTATTAYTKYSAKLADAAKKSLDKKIYASKISYGDAECNVYSQKITIKYTGANPEYFVRVICYDEQNAIESLSILPFSQGGVLSAQYIDRDVSNEIELNMAAWTYQEADAACHTNHIKCVAVGNYTIKKIPVSESGT